ncbi:MAG: TonB-dependent receptor [Flavobacteriales bacterium]|nr:TonB-dependent receptor [Flavobacteriales bacterium]
MKLQVLSYLLLTLGLSDTLAQHAVTGQVMAADGPVPFANVLLQGTSIGAAADEHGGFQLKEVKDGNYTLLFSAIGFRREEVKVTVQGKDVLLGTVRLMTDALGLEEVVVSGTMKESFVTASPVKVEVITTELLERTTSPTNVMQALKLINGVQEVVACGVCNTNSISINGFPGQYTALLVDGSPIYGNLASVYGMNGIPVQMIDRIEVIKGPNSTLYGSEAMAGVINIITKNPVDQPRFAADVRVSSNLETFANVAWSPRVGKWNGTIGANVGTANIYFDDNKDGFGDVINMERVSAFTKWTMKRKDHRKLQLMGKFYYEDRRNGVEAFVRDRAYRTLRGSDSTYGESIYTYRGELFGTYQLPMKEHLRIDFSGSYHNQDSYYGNAQYMAVQWIGFGNLIWNRAVKAHDLTAGLTARYQFYDDNTVATESAPERQFIPGIFIQDEWTLKPNAWQLLGGARLDYYDIHGPVFSPRINLKYRPGQWTTMRLNLGTGFKVVNLFTEDHAFISGQREVVLMEELKPERSYNAALNFNHVYTLGESQGSVDVDGFYTYFTNRIIPNYDTPGQIIYANTDGHVQSWGISALVNHSFRFPVSIRLGFNYLNARQTERNEFGNWETTMLPFASEWSANGVLSYIWKKAHLEFAYTFNLIGPMQLPLVYDLDATGQPLPVSRPTTSKPFYLDNLQVTYRWMKANLRVFIGMENIMDYRQPVSPLTGYNDPNANVGFSPLFDTSYSYSPIHGREFYAGLAWELR